MTDTIALTLIENARGPAAKTFSRKPDGSLEKRSACQIFEGTARRVEVESLEEFIAVRAGLASKQALAYGVSNVPEARLVNQRALSKLRGAIARDRKHFWFADGKPGVFMMDHDRRSDTPPLDALELDHILCKALPELAGVQRAWVPSASAFIYGTDGREFIGAGGWRGYFIVDDASRIPDIGALIYQRLWANGHGYAFVTKAGSIVDRSVIDASVWQPERLDFAAPPILGPGLERHAPAPLFLGGGDA